MSWESEEKLHRLQGSQGSSPLPSASPGGKAVQRARACCHRPVSRDTPPSSSCKEAPVLGLEITGRSRWCIQSSPWVLDLYKPLGLVLTLLLEQDDRVWVAKSQGHFLG